MTDSDREKRWTIWVCPECGFYDADPILRRGLGARHAPKQCFECGQRAVSGLDLSRVAPSYQESHRKAARGSAPLMHACPVVPLESAQELERERDEAVAALEEARIAGQLPRTHDRRYDLTQRLHRAVRWLRDAEDVARVEMPGWPTADRIRSIYEQVTADVLDGKTTVAPIAERLAMAERERDEARTLLRRLDEWDQIRSTAPGSDGPYWRREIAAVLDPSFLPPDREE